MDIVCCTMENGVAVRLFFTLNTHPLFEAFLLDCCYFSLDRMLVHTRDIPS